jgi:H+/Cl- antiporter ClcA
MKQIISSIFAGFIGSFVSLLFTFTFAYIISDVIHWFAMFTVPAGFLGGAILGFIYPDFLTKSHSIKFPSNKKTEENS